MNNERIELAPTATSVGNLLLVAAVILNCKDRYEKALTALGTYRKEELGHVDATFSSQYPHPTHPGKRGKYLVPSASSQGVGI